MTVKRNCQFLQTSSWTDHEYSSVSQNSIQLCRPVYIKSM